MKTLTKEQAINLIRWYENNKNVNWDSWSDYPDLPCGANYLQYDTNICQVNLDDNLVIDGEVINCFSHSRLSVGKKWKAMTFSQLKSIFLPEEVKIEEEKRCASQATARQIVLDYYNGLSEGIRAKINEIWNMELGRKKRQRLLYVFFVENHLKYCKYIQYIIQGDYFPYTEIEEKN